MGQTRRVALGVRRTTQAEDEIEGARRTLSRCRICNSWQSGKYFMSLDSFMWFPFAFWSNR